MITPLLKGLLIGFSIAAPVGPIGVLCIRRSLAGGRLVGFVSGLGAATADAMYGMVATLGLTALMHGLLAQRVWLQAGGGLFLLYLGIGTLRSRPASPTLATTATASLGRAYATTLVLTLTNPMTILSFIAIFAGLGFGASSGGVDGALLVAGVFAGSAAWWLIASTTAGWLGARLPHASLRAVNILAGTIIAGFGVWQLASLLRSLR